ncbi:MAG: hypothetical protein GY768_04810 [Planctomycetaceae bacterium]|nr:hypothetical protein [Planctomycetaceae bacterium]
MKKPVIRSLVQVVCVVAVLAAIAIPLSNLMVSETTADSTMPAVVDVQATEASSAVSALMAGSAVGPARGAVLMPRHPASAFVP